MRSARNLWHIFSCRRFPTYTDGMYTRVALWNNRSYKKGNNKCYPPHVKELGCGKWLLRHQVLFGGEGEGGDMCSFILRSCISQAVLWSTVQASSTVLCKSNLLCFIQPKCSHRFVYRKEKNLDDGTLEGLKETHKTLVSRSNLKMSNFLTSFNVTQGKKPNSSVTINGPFLGLAVGLAAVVHEACKISLWASINYTVLEQGYMHSRHSIYTHYDIHIPSTGIKHFSITDYYVRSQWVVSTRSNICQKSILQLLDVVEAFNFLFHFKTILTSTEIIHWSSQQMQHPWNVLWM